MASSLPTSTDIVIIGGGIVGASIAYHLTQSGCKDVLILERECVQGLGSTGRATGGIRAQFSDPLDVKMSLYSLEFIKNFKECTGVDPAYRPNGYIFLANAKEQMDELKRLIPMQQSAGLRQVKLISREEIAELVPLLKTEDIVGGSFCPSDGFIEPLYLLKGFTKRAEEAGARLFLNTAVTALEIKSGHVVGVQTNNGQISTRTLINAAGAWANAVGAMAGVDVPVRPLRRQVASTQPFSELPDETPMIIGLETGFHFRKDHHGGGGVILLWNNENEPYGENLQFDGQWLKSMLRHAHHRVPAFERLQISPRRCWAGLYEMTPDAHPLLGRAPGVEGFFLANGFSGHGVMHSPATGKLLSELILDGKTRTLDITPLRPERFAEGEPFSDMGLL